MKNTLNKANASKIPMPQELMKLSQTPTGPNFAIPMEILPSD